MKEYIDNKKDLKKFIDWEKKGKFIPPPPIVKHLTINEYRLKYGYDILIETGTFEGDMINAHKNNFKNIISIELNEELYKKAIKRFRKHKNINILQGDSSVILKDVLQNLSENSIFFLDAHYSYGKTSKGNKYTPIVEELNLIINTNKDHIILIDDARHFNGNYNYPTIDELKQLINDLNSSYKFDIEHDIIRLTL